VSDNERHGFRVGDLVRCIYDLYEYYEYLLDYEPSQGYPFHGIIIEIQEDFILPDLVGYERLYIVRCFDGHTRFFAYWEMRLISKGNP